MFEHPVFIITKGEITEGDRFQCEDCLLPTEEGQDFFIIGKIRGPAQTKVVCFNCVQKYKHQQIDYRVFTESFVPKKPYDCIKCHKVIKPTAYAMRVTCDAEKGTDYGALCLTCYDEIGNKPSLMRVLLRLFYWLPNRVWFNNGVE